MATRTFQQVVTGSDELRELVGEPLELSLRKQLSSLDQHCRAFIAHSPFLLIGTSNATGRGDVSPKGDPPGFVQVLDDRTLMIPDRPGNRRLDSLLNILENPQVGLLFLVPGVEETLRVNGRATLVRDEELLETAIVNGKRPHLAIVVEVQEAFIHCAKALKRSHLWDYDSQVERSELPSMAQMMMDQANPSDCTIDELEERIKESYKTRLY